MSTRPVVKLAVVAAVAGGLAAANGVAAPASSPAGYGAFGGPVAQHVAVHAMEVQLTGGTGTLQRVPCAPGALPGTTCYVASR